MKLCIALLLAVSCSAYGQVLVRWYPDNQPYAGLTNYPEATLSVSYTTNAPGWSTNMTAEQYGAYKAAMKPLYLAARSNALVIADQLAVSNALVVLKAYTSGLLTNQHELRDVVRAVVENIVSEINILRGQVVGCVTNTWDAANITSGASLTSPNVTVTGARFGDFVEVGCSGSWSNMIVFPSVVANDTVAMRIYNNSGGAVNLPSQQYKLTVTRSQNMPDRTPDQVRTAIRNSYDSYVNTWTNSP